MTMQPRDPGNGDAASIESDDREQHAVAIPERLGSYRVQGVLGRGGMGVVLRGKHCETGEMAAIKTVTVADEGMLASIRREIRALRQIRHPGVVQIVDQGVSAGLPWYAMELLRGVTLRDHMQANQPESYVSPTDDATQPLAGLQQHIEDGVSGSIPRTASQQWPIPHLVTTLTLLRRLCAPLSFLHGSGLVHRDVKPENVFIQEGGRPVLVDLGIAGRFGGARGREELETTGLVMGTAMYMAPEQIRGEPVDARADLYALGCVMYECLTGRPPFYGTRGSILHQHLYNPAPAPSLQQPALPTALDRLVLSLLEKRPQDRLGYADDVAAALAALGAEDEPKSTPRARAYIYRAELIGRDHTMGVIELILDQLVEQHRGSLILLRGESGVGKTRLAMEISRCAIAHGAEVITGQCDALNPVGSAAGIGAQTDTKTDTGADTKTDTGADQRPVVAGAPLHPLRPLLMAVADRCHKGGATETASLLGPNLKVLRPYEPALAHVPGYDDAPEPEPLAPEAAHTRVITALKTTLFMLAASTPIALLLDDLQWADTLTLNVLQALAEGDVAAHGVLVVGTQRVEEPRSELDALGSAATVTALNLDRLNADDVGAIIAGMLALRAPSRPLVEALASHSEGNPFFVAEYLRAAIGEGILSRDTKGNWHLVAQGLSATAMRSHLRIPNTLAELIERRLQGVDALGQQLLNWGAVLGREFDGELFLTGLGTDDVTTTAALEALRVRHIIEDSDGGQLRFVHDKLREIAYSRLDSAHRRILHRRAAQVIESRHAEAPDMPADMLGILANHYARAGIPARASAYFARAGDHAFTSHANKDAIAHYRAAIAAAERALTADSEALELRRALPSLGERMGDILVLLGQHAEAHRAFLDAVERIPATGADRRQHAIDRARLRRKMAKTWEARHSLEQALAGYAAAEQALGEIPAQLDAGADRQAPEPLPRQLLESLPKPLPKPLPESLPKQRSDQVAASWWDEWLQIQGERISAYYWLARLDRIQTLIETIRPVVERHGTPLQRITFYKSLTRMDLRSHRYRPDRDTVAYTRAHVAAAEELGDMSEIAYAHFSLGLILVLYDALDEAETELAHALTLSERIGSQPDQCRCLTYLTVIHRRLGQLEQAKALAQRSLAATEAIQMIEYMSAARGNLAWVAWRAGQVNEAAQHAQEAAALWARAEYAYPLRWLALLPRMALALAQGALETAIGCAREMLHAEQQQLDDEVAVPLTQAIAGGERGDMELARQALENAVQGAITRRYL